MPSTTVYLSREERQWLEGHENKSRVVRNLVRSEMGKEELRPWFVRRVRHRHPGGGDADVRRTLPGALTTIRALFDGPGMVYAPLPKMCAEKRVPNPNRTAGGKLDSAV